MKKLFDIAACCTTSTSITRPLYIAPYSYTHLHLFTISLCCCMCVNAPTYQLPFMDKGHDSKVNKRAYSTTACNSIARHIITIWYLLLWYGNKRTALPQMCSSVTKETLILAFSTCSVCIFISLLFFFFNFTHGNCPHVICQATYILIIIIMTFTYIFRLESKIIIVTYKQLTISKCFSCWYTIVILWQIKLCRQLCDIE